MAEVLQWPRELIIEIYKKSVDGGFGDDILQMSLEAYKTLENNYYRSSVILAGETLFRVNCEFILWYTKQHGVFEYEDKRKKITLHAQEISGDFKAAESLIENLDINSSIFALRNLNLINKEVFLDMHALRYLRNRIVHSSRPPRLDNYDETIINSEQIMEVILAPSDRKWRKYQFEVSIKREKTKYIVNLERLDIEIANVGYEKAFSVIALGLLFHSMKHVYSQISRTSDR